MKELGHPTHSAIPGHINIFANFISSLSKGSSDLSTLAQVLCATFVDNCPVLSKPMQQPLQPSLGPLQFSPRQLEPAPSPLSFHSPYGLRSPERFPGPYGSGFLPRAAPIDSREPLQAAQQPYAIGGKMHEFTMIIISHTVGSLIRRLPPCA